MSSYKKIVVTGGAGCIGMELIKELLNQEYEIVIIDLPERIEIVIDDIPKEVIIVGASVNKPNNYASYLENCDVVVHLAAMLGVEDTEKNKLFCLYQNIEGTKSILDVCQWYKIKKFIFASSSEVYGEPLNNPVNENSITQGKSVYAISKLAGEEYCKAYYQHAGIEYNILRLFNTYGIYQLPKWVIPIFIKKIKAGEEIIVNGNGKQVRSYTYASDIAKAIINSFSLVNATINVGDDEAIYLNTLIDAIGEIVGKKPKIKYDTNFSSGDRKENREIYTRYCDGILAKKLLDFKKTISIHEGIRKMINENKFLG